MKKGKAYLRSNQQHAPEYSNALFQENENYYQSAPVHLDPIGSGATAAAISKHQEALESALDTVETASNASDAELIGNK